MTGRFAGLAICVTTAVLVFIVPVSASNIIHVPGDQPTIQPGINAANNGDTVLVAPAATAKTSISMGRQLRFRVCSIDALELATEGAESIAPQEISKWLESSTSATQEPFPSPGIGVDVRVEGKDVIGASLVIDNRPIHMELFRRTAPRQAAASDQ